MADHNSRFIWYELLTSDVAAATRFYTALVGWTVHGSHTPGMEYQEIEMGGQAVGGMMAVPAEAAAHGMRPMWLAYVNVPDVDAAIAGITAAGGALRMPPMDIPHVGRFALVTDPQGAALYVMTPIGDGASTAFAPGQPGHGGWHELHSTDWQAALEFYRTQFGWAKSDALDMGPMGTYLLFNAGGDAIGGMMNNPAVPHPMWLYYFNVDDIDAAKARAEKAGGSVLDGPREVPGGSWIIQGKDPQGAMFALVGPRATKQAAAGVLF